MEQDFQTIYNNFNILSYMSSACKIRILDRLNIKLKNIERKYYEAKVDIFNVNDQESLVMI